MGYSRYPPRLRKIVTSPTPGYRRKELAAVGGAAVPAVSYSLT